MKVADTEGLEVVPASKLLFLPEFHLPSERTIGHIALEIGTYIFSRCSTIHSPVQVKLQSDLIG